MTKATDIITSAFREGNIIPVGGTPTTAEQTEGLERLNRLIQGLYGAEMGENLIDWLVPAPQRTATVAANFPQLPYPVDTAGDIFPLPFASDPTNEIYPYPPKNSRIVYGNVTNTVFFPEQPEDGTRMALVPGSGAGDTGVSGAATGTLTQTLLPVNAATVTIATTDGSTPAVYTWKTVIASAFDVLIGASVAASLLNLAAAINLTDGQGSTYGSNTTQNHDVSATVDQETGKLTVTALLPGTGGNSLASTTTDAHGTWTAATLAGGTNGAILTLDGNGRTIEGANTQQYMAPLKARQWLYRADLGDWQAVIDMQLADQMPFPSELDDLFICLLAIRMAPRFNKTVAQDTRDTALRMLKTFKARYRQSGVTVYGSSDAPRSLQSYISGRIWW